MKRSKKIFLALAGGFFLIMIILGYDISKKTSFPGSKKLIIESLAPSDTIIDESKIEKLDTLEIDQGE